MTSLDAGTNAPHAVPQFRGLSRYRTALLAAIAGLAPAPGAFAQNVATAFTYQGELTVLGAPASSPVDLRFTLYGVPSGGAPLAGVPVQCAAAVTPDNGRFAVQLDFGNQFPGADRYVQIEVRSAAPGGCAASAPYTLLAGRQRLTASPYAITAGAAGTAGTAANLNGQPASFYLNAANLNAGVVPDDRLAPSVVRTFFSNTFSGTNAFAGTTTFTGFTQLTNPLNSLAGNGAALTALNASNVSTGTLADARLSANVARLNATQTFSGNNTFNGSTTISNGAFFGAHSGDGAGLTSLNASNLSSGILPDARLSPAVARRDVSQTFVGNNTFNGNTTMNGSFIGVNRSSPLTSNEVFGVSSSGVFGYGGMYVNVDTPSGAPFYGYANTGASSTWTYFEPNSAQFRVYNGGERLAIDQSGRTGINVTNPAVTLDVGGDIRSRGTDFMLDGRGGGLGNNNRRARALVDAGDGFQIGIAGLVLNFGNDFGGTFSDGSMIVNGNLDVLGNVSKFGGTFKIDHPLDPENKYLYHSFVESPDMMNIYNGAVTTDETGYATVTMPAYFEALNREFRYQLTVIDDADSDAFVLAKVVRQIEGNQFTIRTSLPGATVSWQVTGIRQDPWAERNRVRPEVEKEPAARGKYLAPEAYGLPAARGINGSRATTPDASAR